MKHDWDLLARVTRQEFCALAPAPHAAVAHGVGTDISRDLAVLWAVVTMLKPMRSIEIGTRHGISTRTIAHALAAEGLPKLVTIDPDPSCRKRLNGVNCTFLAATGEAVFANKLFAKHYAEVKFLFLDTDPHTFDQSWRWLETWIARRLVVGGCAAFHDIVAPEGRPEIQVADAVREWVARNKGWMWLEYPPETQEPEWNGGIGLLWRKA